MNTGLSLSWQAPQLAQFLRTDTPSPMYGYGSPGSSEQQLQLYQLSHSGFSWLHWAFLLLGRPTERLLRERQGSLCPFSSINRQDEPQEALVTAVPFTRMASTQLGLVLPTLGAWSALFVAFSVHQTPSLFFFFLIQAQGLTAQPPQKEHWAKNQAYQIC